MGYISVLVHWRLYDMNYSELQNSIQNILQRNDSTINDTLIPSWINEIQKRICQSYRFFSFMKQSPTGFDLTIGERNYALPDTYWVNLFVYFLTSIDGNQLQRSEEHTSELQSH